MALGMWTTLVAPPVEWIKQSGLLHLQWNWLWVTSPRPSLAGHPGLDPGQAPPGGPTRPAPGSVAGLLGVAPRAPAGLPLRPLSLLRFCLWLVSPSSLPAPRQPFRSSHINLLEHWSLHFTAVLCPPCQAVSEAEAWSAPALVLVCPGSLRERPLPASATWSAPAHGAGTRARAIAYLKRPASAPSSCPWVSL